MSEFSPVFTLEDADILADIAGDEMVAGYVAGLNGEPEPVANTCSRAHWHGWRNGRVDGGHAEPDAAQRMLALAYVNLHAQRH